MKLIEYEKIEGVICGELLSQMCMKELVNKFYKIREMYDLFGTERLGKHMAAISVEYKNKEWR